MSKTTPSLPTGLTLTEYIEQRVDKGGPFVYHDPFGGIPQRVMPAKPAHHLYKPTFWSWWQCKRCGFKTQKVSDIRNNSGCNAFSNYDSEKDRRFKFEDLNTKPIYLDIKEDVIRGCNIENRSEWVQYIETGTAIQEDKFINEQVKESMKEYARIRR